MIGFERRAILGGSALVGLVVAGPTSSAWAFSQPKDALPNLAKAALPISVEERLSRITKVQSLMRTAGLGALLVEPGSSLVYFSGIEWWRSERVTALLIPADGDAIVITPFFEAPSIRESLAITADVRTWNEDESPFALAAEWLRERKLDHFPVAIEETVRRFVVDGLQSALPAARLQSGTAIVRACRMHKSPAEIALMQLAADITVAAFRNVGPRIAIGMTPMEVGQMIQAATTEMGAESDLPLVLIGEASAYPHGSGMPQRVREGDVILIDGGCSVQGYTSDISRTMVFGGPSKAQRLVWDQVHRGQQIALEAAKLGMPAGSVDDQVRAWYEKLGYGPGYRLPGLSHRTGHGIGMDGHEPVNLVHGETTLLQPGMCFSNEPGIYIPGQFGIRLEDCFHMTAEGPQWFSTPPPSIDNPFG
ncbi:M24 family metallopeptidase [Aquisediminimonas profunda]|uniref:M24 family metallopeptidase n=1 Tax=Aquisediminimonas profunda TaxID=1550733 RepID=UPI001C63ABDE|nr:Xaa-Pro peptidase family protein [Aquisediminimonas profunda]